MTETLIDWDDAFANLAYLPNADAVVASWPQRAEAFRTALTGSGGAKYDLDYGSKPRNLFDLFLPEGKASGLLIIVHGGYWMKTSKSDWSFLARGGLDRGYAVAMPGYTLAPQARIHQMTVEIACAIETIAAHIEGPIYLAGHSAGGHLVSRMACADTPLAAAVQGRLAHVMSISGLHDLRPLCLTKMNETLGLSAQEAASESAALQAPGRHVPTTFWVGAQERPEFLRQTRLGAETWERAGATVGSHYDPGCDHFSVLEGLCDPESAMMSRLFDGIPG